MERIENFGFLFETFNRVPGRILLLNLIHVFEFSLNCFLYFLFLELSFLDVAFRVCVGCMVPCSSWICCCEKLEKKAVHTIPSTPPSEIEAGPKLALELFNLHIKEILEGFAVC